MCGRYVLKANKSELDNTYRPAPGYLAFRPNYNVTPTSQMPVVFVDDQDRQIDLFRWGLIPSWSKGLSSKYTMINARSETLAEKPAYRDAYHKRRCIVPASGFYEWKKTPDGKQPYYVTPTEGELFSFAGLYEYWTGDNETIQSYTIITTSANRKINEIHDRMPAILLGKEIDQWLDPDIRDTKQLQDMLRPHPEDGIEFYPVSTSVNNPRNNEEDLITSIAN